jgi:hypothetical protein
LRQVGTERIELLNAVITSVRDVDITCLIDCNTKWLIELPIAGPGGSPLIQVIAQIVELLDSVVSAISYKSVASLIDRDVERQGKLAIAGAWATPLV